MIKREYKGFALTAASAVLYGLMPMAVVLLDEAGVNAFTVTAGKSWLSLPVLFLICKYEGFVKPTGKQFLVLLIAAICMNLATPMLLYISYSCISTGMATTLHFVYPVIVLLGCAFLFRQPIRAVHFVCIAIDIVGIALFYLPCGEMTSTSVVGVLLALASGVAYAGYILCIDTKELREYTPIQLTFYITLISSMLLPFAAPLFGGLTLPVGKIAWVSYALISVASGFLCMVLFQRGVKCIGPQRAAILSTFEPMTSIIVGAFFFSEKLSIYEGIGCMAILVSVVILVLRDEP